MTEPVAFAWAGLQPNDHSIQGGMTMNVAKNKEDFINALMMMDGLAVSVVFATVYQ